LCRHGRNMTLQGSSSHSLHMDPTSLTSNFLLKKNNNNSVRSSFFLSVNPTFFCIFIWVISWVATQNSNSKTQ
jgi:hypothetical protein